LSRNKIKYMAKYDSTLTLLNRNLKGKPGIKAIPSRKHLRMILLFFVIIFLGSCSNMRYLEENQQLFTGASIAIESEEKIKNKGEIKNELERVVRPQPNQKFLIWRIRLWLYNIAGEPTGKGLRHQLRNRFGRPPVLFEDVSPDRISRLMENRLFNMGFFDANVGYEVKEKKKTVGLDFQIFLNTPFEIRDISPVQSDFPIANEINNSLERSLLRSGQHYQLNRLKEERERIDKHLKELGYFYFHPDFLLFQVDSTVGNRQVDLQLGIKTGAPEEALTPYMIRNVLINITHGFGASEPEATADTIEIKEGMFLVDDSGEFKPVTIGRAVFFKKDELYKRRDHDLTLNHLMGLGVFNFVNMRFMDVQQNGEHSLDVRILLTPMDKKSLGAEIRGVSKSTNFVGPGLNVSFSNRNAFRGAEQFTLSLDGAFETLIGQRQKNVNSFETGITAGLDIPRFVAPGRIKNISPLFIPHTQVNVGLIFKIVPMHLV
jgi:outer membrane protein insertion porin family